MAEPPLIQIPYEVFPLMRFRSCGSVPPMTLPDPALTSMPVTPEGENAAVPEVFVPMKQPLTVPFVLPSRTARVPKPLMVRP